MEISRVLQAPAVTVRKKLEELEQAGLLRRIRGGAVTSDRQYFDGLLPEADQPADCPYQGALAAAAGEIRDRETVFLSDGVRTLQLFRTIPEGMHCNIFTNSAAIALEARSDPRFNVVLLGGTVGLNCPFTGGADAEEQLMSYSIDRVVFEVDAASDQYGLMVGSPSQLVG